MPRGQYARNYGEAQCDYCRVVFTRRMQGQRFCQVECREASREGNNRAFEVLNNLEQFIAEQRAKLSATG